MFQFPERNSQETSDVFYRHNPHATSLRRVCLRSWLLRVCKKTIRRLVELYSRRELSLLSEMILNYNRLFLCYLHKKRINSAGIEWSNFNLNSRTGSKLLVKFLEELFSQDTMKVFVTLFRSSIKKKVEKKPYMYLILRQVPPHISSSFGPYWFLLIMIIKIA